MSYFKDVVGARELLLNLTLREVRGKYRRTLFGQLWSLLNPLVLMCIYWLVFGLVIRLEPEQGDPSGLDIFPLWLLCGLLPWLFFASAVLTSTGSLVANSGLITKVYFPRLVLPLSAVAAASYNWLFEMAVLVIVLAIAGSMLWAWLPLMVLVMLLLAGFAAGMGMLISVLNVHFRDTEHFLSLVLQVWMYASPIIYPMSLVRGLSEQFGGLLGTPITIEGIYSVNPIVHFVDVFRALLYDNRWPEPMSLLLCAIWSIAALAIGYLVFRRNDKSLAEQL